MTKPSQVSGQLQKKPHITGLEGQLTWIVKNQTWSKFGVSCDKRSATREIKLSSVFSGHSIINKGFDFSTLINCTSEQLKCF